LVTVVGATTLSASASARARGGVAAVVLADLEAGAAGVGAGRVAGLVHAGGDEDHAAQRALAAGHRRHALVVDPVLEVDDNAVRPHQVGRAQRGRPLGVVRLHRDEHGVERPYDALHLVQVQRRHGNDVVAAGARQAQAPALERLDVLRPLVDQDQVVAGPREQPPDDTSDRPRADDADPHAHRAGAYPGARRMDRLFERRHTPDAPRLWSRGTIGPP
jgi:hypothetical protein